MVQILWHLLLIILIAIIPKNNAPGSHTEIVWVLGVLGKCKRCTRTLPDVRCTPFADNKTA